jgi:hypothetical protein
MSKTSTFKQYQLLSDYLDERCSPRDKARVESLLKSDPELRKTFAEFQRCRKMLRAIPQMRAPRNFTLSPSMVPQKPQRFFLAPMLNYAALVAAVLFVFLFAGSRLLPLATAKSVAVPEAMMMAAAPAADTAAETTDVQIIIWGGAYGKGGGGGGAEGSGIGGGAPDSQPMITTSQGDLTTGLAPETTTEDTNVAGDTDASGLILGLPDPSTQGQVTVAGGEPTADTITEIPRAYTPFPWVLVGEITFAFLAVGLAVAALFIRKRR